MSWVRLFSYSINAASRRDRLGLPVSCRSGTRRAYSCIKHNIFQFEHTTIYRSPMVDQRISSSLSIPLVSCSLQGENGNTYYQLAKQERQNDGFQFYVDYTSTRLEFSTPSTLQVTSHKSELTWRDMATYLYQYSLSWLG